MQRVKLYITIVLIVSVAAFLMLASVRAENKKTGDSTAKTHVKEQTLKEKHGNESVKSEPAKEGEESHAEEEEEESAWRIPGWQTIFAILAVGYYIVISLNILPKIAAKDLEGHH